MPQHNNHNNDRYKLFKQAEEQTKYYLQAFNLVYDKLLNAEAKHPLLQKIKNDSGQKKRLELILEKITKLIAADNLQPYFEFKIQPNTKQENSLTYANQEKLDGLQSILTEILLRNALLIKLINTNHKFAKLSLTQAHLKEEDVFLINDILQNLISLYLEHLITPSSMAGSLSYKYE